MYIDLKYIFREFRNFPLSRWYNIIYNYVVCSKCWAPCDKWHLADGGRTMSPENSSKKYCKGNLKIKLHFIIIIKSLVKHWKEFNLFFIFFFPCLNKVWSSHSENTTPSLIEHASNDTEYNEVLVKVKLIAIKLQLFVLKYRCFYKSKS